MSSIAEQWEHFKANVLPPELDEESVENARYAFYTGFAAAMQVMYLNTNQEQPMAAFKRLAIEYDDYCTRKFAAGGVSLQ